MRLNHSSYATYPCVALLPVQCGHLGDQLGQVKSRGNKAGLKVIHFPGHNSLLLIFFQNMWRNMFRNSSPKGECNTTWLKYKICILKDTLKASRLLWDYAFGICENACGPIEIIRTCWRNCWPQSTPCLLSQMPFLICAILTYHTHSFNDVLD